MTSERRGGTGSRAPVPDRAFAWTWTEGATEPVVLGALSRDGERFAFNYARSWLARPDAFPLLDAGSRKVVAKFASSTDARSVVRAEFVGMRLARAAGLEVAPVELAEALGRDVLLVERFDRARAERGWTRRHLVSALALLELDEMMARYASYETFADVIRTRFEAPRRTLRRRRSWRSASRRHRSGSCPRPRRSRWCVPRWGRCSMPGPRWRRKRGSTGSRAAGSGAGRS